MAQSRNTISTASQIGWGLGYIAGRYGTPAVTTGASLVPAADGSLVTPCHLCPDLLRYENIGAADGLRGRAVRAFFWIMRVWRP